MLKIIYCIKMEIITKTAKETQRVAKILAKEIIKMPVMEKGALVLILSGELGAGKTTFVQGFVAGLGIKEEVSSPTFLIMKKIELHKHDLRLKTKDLSLKTKFKNLYHLDCYRLKNEKDLIDLDIKEIIEDRENIILIEWPERIKKILPKDLIKINFEYKSLKERLISFQWVEEKK